MGEILQLKNDYQSVIKDWLWPILGAFLLLYVTKFYITRRKFVKLIDKIAGPKSFPILGNIREIGYFNASISHNIAYSTVFNDIKAGVSEIFDKEKMFRLWLMGRPIVFLYSAEAIEKLLSSSISVNKSFSYYLTKPWLGNGLLVSKGSEWKSRRKMLTPTFHFKILQDFLPIMNHHSVILVNEIRKKSKQPSVDVVPMMTYCTLDIIGETAMGVKLQCQDNPNSKYAKAVHNATLYIFNRMLKPWLYNDFIYGLTKEGKLFEEEIKVIQEMTAKVIKEKKESKLLEMKTKGISVVKDNDDGAAIKRKLAFLDLLLEKHLDDPTFTEDDIKDEVNTFMFGGHDTTATSLTWILFLLGLHSDVQEKLYEEVSQVFGDENFQPEITQDEIKDLKYMEMVIKECQRLYPSIPEVARETEEDIQIGDIIIPKGIEAIVFMQQLHKDKEVFPDPEIFNPERFSPENSHGRHPYSFLPFSAGPRNCIGQKFAMMEEKVILSHILLNFKIRSLDQRDKVMVAPEVVLRAGCPVRAVFQSRLDL